MVQQMSVDEATGNMPQFHVLQNKYNKKEVVLLSNYRQ